jgi:hypothetical protein
MEYIYIAKSASHPGMVKIGRTDQTIDERMQQLSEENYGPEGFSGNADWEAVTVIKVDNNVEAEALLHDHFSSERVTDSRELFYCEDVEGLSTQAIQISQGQAISFLNDPGIDEFILAGMVGTDDVGDLIEMPVMLGLLFGFGAYAWYKISPTSFNNCVGSVPRAGTRKLVVNPPSKAKQLVGNASSLANRAVEQDLPNQLWSDFKSASQAATALSKTKKCTVKIIRTDAGWSLQAT